MSSISSAFRYLEDVPVSECQLEIIKKILTAPLDEALDELEDEGIDESSADCGSCARSVPHHQFDRYATPVILTVPLVRLFNDSHKQSLSKSFRRSCPY